MSATATTTAVPTGTWAVDPAHSRVEFQVKHLGISTVRGNFSDFEGTLELGEDLASAKASGTVNVVSVNTDEPKRDDHLRSPDFFHVDEHPHIEFQSTAIEPLDEDRFRITGDLTLHGVTREITLTAELLGTEEDPYGNERVALEVRGALNRGEYGMTFNQALGSGNVLVSDKVKLALDISAIKQG
jgi:polyisoprenoid-binding protein YceI